jgi:oxaloacetate decarboxylase alpha subunit
MIPDENLMYLAGHFGPPPGPIAAEVLDRAFSTPRGRDFQTWTPPQPSLAEIRHAYGENLSDEELLLRYLMPAEDVDAMYAAGPVQRALAPDPDEAPEIGWIKEILSTSTARSVQLAQGRVSVHLSR